MEITLASASPRRRRLLELAGFRVLVQVPHVAEDSLEGELPGALAQRLAAAKARSIAAPSDRVVVAGDTLVLLDGRPIGKPESDAAAAEILASLSGRAHQVISGYCVCRGERAISGLAATEVAFRTLHPDEIRRYIASGEPRGKAGAYAIQGTGGSFVEGIRGSFSNVVGLPLLSVLPAIEELTGP